MDTKSLKDSLTIVIPAKNESRTLWDCVYHLSRQLHIQGTRLIIADVSDTKESLKWVRRVVGDFSHILNIEVIKGGFPSEGRLSGSKLATTPQLLFLDADVFLTQTDTLIACVSLNPGLLTVPFRTDPPYRWVFRAFDLFQGLSKLLGTPFAVGGFQLWKSGTYWGVGGYDPSERFAEDYSLSQKVRGEDFRIHRIGGVYTSPRRFRSKGILWMFSIMIKSYLNRKNPQFFKHHHNYWG